MTSVDHPTTFVEAFNRWATQVSSVIQGKDGAIREALICFLCGGHLLIEDVPGMGKTTLARAIAASAQPYHVGSPVPALSAWFRVSWGARSGGLGYVRVAVAGAQRAGAAWCASTHTPRLLPPGTKDWCARPWAPA